MTNNVELIFSPLEQFELVLIYPLNFFGFIDFSVTNSTIYMVFISFFIIFTFILLTKKLLLIPTTWQVLVEELYKFVVETLEEQAGKSAIKFFPLCFLIFIFILICNLTGLFPFGFTVTGHIIITFAIAFSLNFGLVILGFSKHGILFLKLFVPSEAPLVLVPLITCIEVVSYLLRTFSLSLRLFANMMAGHTLLHILALFTIGFLGSNFFITSIFPILILAAVCILELGIAFLQAYVFFILFCIYLNDSLNLH